MAADSGDQLILFVLNIFLNHATIFYNMLYYCTSFACSRLVLLVMTSLTYWSKFVHFSAIFSQSFTAYLKRNSLKLWAMTTKNVSKRQLNGYQRFFKAFFDSKNNWLRFFRTSDPSAINRHRVFRLKCQLLPGVENWTWETGYINTVE